jgi:hypothetical protein
LNPAHHPAKLSRDFCEQGFLRLFKRLDGHLVRDSEAAAGTRPVNGRLEVVDEFLNGTRVPRKQGVPFMISGRTTITRSSGIGFILLSPGTGGSWLLCLYFNRLKENEPESGYG